MSDWLSLDVAAAESHLYQMWSLDPKLQSVHHTTSNANNALTGIRFFRKYTELGRVQQHKVPVTL